MIWYGNVQLRWTWDLANPTNWTVQSSADGVSGWTYYATAGGNLRELPPSDTGLWYRVIGVDGGGNAVTPMSNKVFATV